ncbi:hypothetical protein ACOSQ2_010273 [Xanthoceras sorbifolium]
MNLRWLTHCLPRWTISFVFVFLYLRRTISFIFGGRSLSSSADDRLRLRWTISLIFDDRSPSSSVDDHLIFGG